MKLGCWTGQLILHDGSLDKRLVGVDDRGVQPRLGFLGLRLHGA